MRIVFRNLTCHRRKNIVMMSVVVFAAVLLNAYTGNIRSSKSQLQELADVTPVLCYISNMSGSKTAGLDINEKNLKRILGSEHTKDVVYTVKVNGGVGDIPLSEWYKLGYNVMGTNSIKGIPDLENADVKMEGDKEKFFGSDENIALFSKEYLEKNNLMVGDEISFTLYYYQYDDLDIFCHPLDVVTIRIVGEMPERVSSLEGYAVDVVFPARYLEKVFEANNIRFSADSLSFYLKDPLRINEAKEEFKGMYLLSRSPDAMESYMGIALNMTDATFISLAGNIRRNIRLLEIFTAPLCILLFALGFLLSFILIRNWRAEYMTMRLLGVYERQCFTFYCAEILVLSVIGTTVGNAVTRLTQKEVPNVMHCILIIMSCLMGACAALFFTRKEMRENSTWK